MTKPRQGPLMAGEPVQLTDPKGRSHLITLRAGASFHTHRGSLSHDDIIGGPDGNVIKAAGGTPYVVFRPLLADYTLAMKRGAAVVYPKDAAQIVAYADVFPGARVLEAGAGSGAISCWLLRAVGPDGEVVSFEARADFAEIARENVRKYFGEVPSWWRLVSAPLSARAALDPSFRADRAYSLRKDSRPDGAADADGPDPEGADPGPDGGGAAAASGTFDR